MKILRHKNENKWGDPDRYSNTFFIIGTLVVFAVVFFLGLQVGRMVEKDRASGFSARKDEGQKKEKIEREMSAYSEEAVQIPVVMPPPPPPDPIEELKTSEKAVTFPDSLTSKDAVPQPLVKSKAPAPPPPKPAAVSTAKKAFIVQASAFRSRESADALKAKLDKKGYKAKVVREAVGGKDLFKVQAGAYKSKEDANKTVKDISSAFKINPIIVSE
ncbi:MAG: SPOR domain-containing protein [Syntrophorhabdaceae bacterium]|nr:SPOR domain-containing protein [Syntrophorhabdaceae bacterium]